MYNKLFTKILDSSIWLAPDPHRLVWITLIAAMDQNGMTQFACPENLAARARVSLPATLEAIAAFEAPDPYDITQEYEGRRIERIPGGWLVLNAEKYRGMVSRVIATEQAKERMHKYRERKKEAALRSVTHSYALLQKVTPSESESEADHKQSQNKEATSIDVPKPKRRSRSQIGEMELTAELKGFAETKLSDVDAPALFANFRDHHLSKGTAAASWEASWRTWVGKALEWGYPRLSKPSGPMWDEKRNLIVGPPWRFKIYDEAKLAGLKFNSQQEFEDHVAATKVLREVRA